MPRVRQEDVEQLKERVDIVEVIGSYIALKPASAGSFKGLCPFHGEKTPSFNVRANPAFYHCFGCGVGGDVYKFVQEIENISFAEAIEKLAERTGFQLTYDDSSAPEEKSNRSRMLQLNKAASEYFQRQLASEEGGAAREFLISRGFDAAAANQFGIGYAPKGWQNLITELSGQGYSLEEMVKVGLASPSDKGGYDRFRGRVLWPIRDANNQVLGFGARKLYEDDDGPKYLNTPETPVYHKSAVLYGLDLARKEIAKQRRVIVVEGYTDVMACHLAGETTAVATCGTAFGEEHINLINRLLGQSVEPAEVIFTFDPDVAGQKAALKVYGDSAKFNALTFVATGPDGLDPADLRQQQGDQAIARMIAQKKPLFEFVIRHRISQFALTDLDSRVAAARAAAPVVAQISDPALRSGYLRQLAEWVSLELTEVSALVANTRTEIIDQAVAPMRSTPAAPRQQQLNRLERETLQVLVQQPNYFSTEQLRRIFAADLIGQELRPILSCAMESAATDRDSSFASYLIANTDQSLHGLIRELALAEMPVKSDAEMARYCQGIVSAAMLQALSREKTDLLAALKRIDPSSGADQVMAVQQQLVELENERRKLMR